MRKFYNANFFSLYKMRNKTISPPIHNNALWFLKKFCSMQSLEILEQQGRRNFSRNERFSRPIFWLIFPLKSFLQLWSFIDEFVKISLLILILRGNSVKSVTHFFCKKNYIGSNQWWLLFCKLYLEVFFWKSVLKCLSSLVSEEKQNSC